MNGSVDRALLGNCHGELTFRYLMKLEDGVAASITYNGHVATVTVIGVASSSIYTLTTS